MDRRDFFRATAGAAVGAAVAACLPALPVVAAPSSKVIRWYDVEKQKCAALLKSMRETARKIKSLAREARRLNNP